MEVALVALLCSYIGLRPLLMRYLSNLSVFGRGIGLIIVFELWMYRTLVFGSGNSILVFVYVLSLSIPIDYRLTLSCLILPFVQLFANRLSSHVIF